VKTDSSGYDSHPESLQPRCRAGSTKTVNFDGQPVTAIMASLLYLKTRKAGGESLRDASEQFEALDIPRSKWQARMKSVWTKTHAPTGNR
jgi:hypothetical protein